MNHSTPRSSKTVAEDQQEAKPLFDQVNPKLRTYIETHIFPEYSKNEWGHQLGHIKYVIRRSFKFAEAASAQSDEPLSPDIIYTVAAYHDLGHHIDAANHEKVSAQLLREDEQLKQLFSPAEIETIAEAIEDHRSHRKELPRSIYGKIIASADCNINIEVMLHRTYSYRLRNFDSSSLEEIIDNSRRHLAEKYGKNGFANNKMFFDDPEFDVARQELQTLTANEELFRERFLKTNHLERSYELEGQLSSYLARVNPDLRTYVEANIFPAYSKNDPAHGILHIREVIRRAFVLNDSFSLHLNPDLIYTIAAYHDLGKHIDSEHHEIISAELFQKDKKIADYFSEGERRMIAEAIEDHRSSKSDHPRSIYGKLISSADRNTRIEQVFIRSFFVGKNRQPQTTVADFLDFTFQRLSKRYDQDDPENMFFADQEYANFFTDMRRLLQDEETFKNRYCEVNQISDRTHTLGEDPGVKISPIILI